MFDFSAKYESNMFSVYFSVYLAFLKSTHEYFCIGNKYKVCILKDYQNRNSMVAFCLSSTF